MKVLTIGLLIVLCGCASPAHTAQSSSSASPGASASTTPSLPAGTPCRLPFLGEAASPFGPGFVSYPEGTFTPDPSGVLHGLPDGVGLETYDWAFSRWVPAPYGLVSPDGLRYASSELIPNPAGDYLGGPPPLGTRVHVVDIATGTDTIVFETQDVLSAHDFRSDGIYLTQKEPVDTATPFFVWVVDPVSRSIRRLLGGRQVGPGVFYITSGALWITAIDTGNPTDPGGAFNQLLRINLADGSQTIWFEQPQVIVSLLGMNQRDEPIISTYSSGNGDPGKTWLVKAPNSAQAIANNGFNWPAVADSHGLWLSGYGPNEGVLLYPAGGPIQKVSNELGLVLGTCG